MFNFSIQVFDFCAYTVIEKLKNSEFFSKLVNFKAVDPFKEVLNVRDFRVFNFHSFTEIKKLENSKIYQDLKLSKQMFHFRKLEIPEVFRY